jgi:hypothetical protein
VRPGCAERRSSAAPATIADAALVPLAAPVLRAVARGVAVGREDRHAGREERRLLLIERVQVAVARARPELLNVAGMSSPGRPLRCTSHAPTAITPSPAAGEGTCAVRPSLPTEATTTMPSATARAAAREATSLPSLRSGSRARG